ncbi:MAG TPA: helix-turn-helix domain-containing protein [Flavisolibacter sp.]|nr:helix-turn-helix domain-containing protein [Flavisolibacter sp.]
MGIAKKIKNEADYNKIMTQIDELMGKGSGRVSKKELAEIRSLALKAQQYEQQKYVIEPPTTLAGIIELKMYERKLKQKDLARELNVSTAKLSLILSGKQRPDVDFLKAVHQQLGVNGDFLLSVV